MLKTNLYPLVKTNEQRRRRTKKNKKEIDAEEKEKKNHCAFYRRKINKDGKKMKIKGFKSCERVLVM